MRNYDESNMNLLADDLQYELEKTFDEAWDNDVRRVLEASVRMIEASAYTRHRTGKLAISVKKDVEPHGWIIGQTDQYHRALKANYILGEGHNSRNPNQSSTGIYSRVHQILLAEVLDALDKAI